MRDMLPLMLLLACGGQVEPISVADLDCDGDSDSQVMVMRTITFARASADGLSDGFDLDGRVSVEGDPNGCFVGDYVNLEGDEGIDNGFAQILPLLDRTEAAAIEPLLQSSINAGDLLLTVQLVDLDDPMDDACVDVRVSAALGNPVVGSDDRIIAGQTYEWDRTADSQQALDASIVDGRVDVELPQFALAVSILDADIKLQLTDVRLRLDYDEITGTWHGILAGGLFSDALLAVVASENVDPGLVGTLENLLRLTSDLAPITEGQCERISVTLNFEAVSAFYYDLDALE